MLYLPFMDCRPISTWSSALSVYLERLFEEHYARIASRVLIAETHMKWAEAKLKMSRRRTATAFTHPEITKAPFLFLPF